MANSRLSERKEGLWSRIKRIALTDVGALMRGLNADDLEKMERVLIEADFGVSATIELTQALEDEVRKGTAHRHAERHRASGRACPRR
jgi:signal recognition particle GTPase